MTGIYMFVNKKDGKMYIGQSTNIARRREEHYKWPSPYSKFDNYISKLGPEQFDFKILEECSADQLDEREMYWINYYDSINKGYNLTPGGQSYRGISNPAAVLNEEQVKEIIGLLAETDLTQQEIADEYKVHRNTIDLINRCQIWTHLHNYKNNIRQTHLNQLERPHSVFAGESSKSHKISENTALQIINLLENSKISQAEMSRQLEVSLNIIYDINKCKTWTYLHSYTKNIRKEANEKRGNA